MSDPTDALPPIDDTPDNTDATQPPESEVEGATPPGYDWPTHGGYLGCLVGSIAACLVTGFFGADLFSFFYIARGWPFPIFALLTLVLFVALVVGLGQLGWQLGKRFYRYYPQPKPTWGESDDESDEAESDEAESDEAEAVVEAEGARAREGVRGQAAINDVDVEAAGEPVMRSAAGSVDGENVREMLVESRQRQDDSGDGGREAADQAEDADHESQRP